MENGNTRDLERCIFDLSDYATRKNILSITLVSRNKLYAEIVNESSLFRIMSNDDGEKAHGPEATLIIYILMVVKKFWYEHIGRNGEQILYHP